MTWLTISIAINIALIVIIFLYVMIYSRNVRQAKLATFSAVLQALSYGIAVTDNDERYRRLAISFGTIFGDVSTELIEELLKKSSIFGYLSSRDPSLIDLLPERDRLAAVRFAVRHGADAAKVDEMWQYVKRALALEDGYMEPAQRYSGEELKKGQIFSEARLIDLYELALKKTSQM